jgi:hypothetical protein
LLAAKTLKVKTVVLVMGGGGDVLPPAKAVAAKKSKLICVLPEMAVVLQPH